MIYGYCRVSTKAQKIERQIINLKQSFPKIEIFSEKFTGTTTDRPEWVRLMKKVRAGDTIVFDSVSRMSRNKTEGVEDYFVLYNKGVELIFLKEPHINTSVYRNALKTAVPLTGTSVDCMVNIINQSIEQLARKPIEDEFIRAELEVDDLHHRISEGMKASKAGDKISQSRTGNKYPRNKSILAKEIIITNSRDFKGSLADKECAKKANVSIATFYRIKKEIKENQSR